MASADGLRPAKRHYRNQTRAQQSPLVKSTTDDQAKLQALRPPASGTGDDGGQGCDGKPRRHCSAARNHLDEPIIGQTMQRARHQEFITVLNEIEREGLPFMSAVYASNYFVR